MKQKLKTAFNILLSYIIRLALSPLRLLPVNKKRVLFVCYRGKQYACNPRAISEKLEGKGLELIWAFHHPEEFGFLKERGINVVGDRGLRFAYLALTSRVVITNTYYKPFLPRRRKQFYLRTWHGGGAYKRVNYPGGLTGYYIRMQQQGADLYLSSSSEFTKGTLREAFGYKGEVLEAGMPRNDIFFDAEKADKVAGRLRGELDIPADTKLALYAPTYRDKGTPPEIDENAVLSALRERFGGEWKLLYRGHHVYDRAECEKQDMQELLCLADVLLTDYSSSMWDMSLSGKPVFLFAPDISRYKAERDFFMDIRSWPFPLAESITELCENIKGFDKAKYAADVKKHHEALGSCETGKAADKAAERVIRECGTDK